MIGDTKTKYCPICDGDTDHLQGTFKSKEINGELFHLSDSLSDSLKKVSAGFKDFVMEEHGGIMNAGCPGNYAATNKGGLNLGEMFAPQVRALKCCDCNHLIKISRLP